MPLKRKPLGGAPKGSMTIVVRYSPVRVLVVTAGLAVAGATCGGLAAAVALALALLPSEGMVLFSDPGVLRLAAVVGAGIGSVLAPIAGWLLLRHVPLGRAFAGLTIGTIVGGVVGWFIPNSDLIITPILAAALGFVCASLIMRWRAAVAVSSGDSVSNGAT